jgi:hypothetical protein
MAKGTLATLGSGETAPGMTTIYRDLPRSAQTQLDDLRDVTVHAQANIKEGPLERGGLP